MTPDPLNLLIAGVGGQGNVLASALIGRAAVDAGLFAAVGETYGASQRGGAVTSHVRLAVDHQPAPLIPRGACHLLLGLEPAEALRAAREHAGPQTQALVNCKPLYPLATLRGDRPYPEPEAISTALRAHLATVWTTDLYPAAEQLGEPMTFNVLMVGALAGRGVLPFGLDALEAVLPQLLPASKVELNREALRWGASQEPVTPF